MFVRTEPGLNALPGWAPPAQQAAIFEEIAAAHLASVGTFIHVAVVPAIGVWVLAFAIVQTICGVALLVGYRTRLFGTITVGYLTLLSALGFVRLAPLLLVSALAAATLGGRHVSLDSVSGRDPRPPKVSDRAAVPAIAVAVVFGTAGVVLGVEPGGYDEREHGGDHARDARNARRLDRRRGAGQQVVARYPSGWRGYGRRLRAEARPRCIRWPPVDSVVAGGVRISRLEWSPRRSRWRATFDAASPLTASPVSSIRRDAVLAVRSGIDPAPRTRRRARWGVRFRLEQCGRWFRSDLREADALVKTRGRRRRAHR